VKPRYRFDIQRLTKSGKWKRVNFFFGTDAMLKQHIKKYGGVISNRKISNGLLGDHTGLWVAPNGSIDSAGNPDFSKFKPLP